MKFIIAKKLDMTQRFREDGTVVPVTLLQAGPCVVTQIRNADRDGYDAVQLGAGTAREKVVAKPQRGHMKASGHVSRELDEFRTDGPSDLKVGDSVEVSQFNPGEFVQVTATSKGRGFQGVVKRHGFRGGPASHGHKDNLRMPGSIGSGGIQRVFKGMRMAGRMGGDQVTVKNLEIIEVDVKNGIMAVKGAVPGARGASVLVSGGFDKRQSWN
ncbi:MAG: 50S ribosomal protein L3 [bacterium]